MGTCPLPSMDFPQQGHEGASFDISLPGTVRILARLWHLLVEVPNSSVRALSCGTSVCTNPSRCEGSWMKPGAHISSALEIGGSWAATDATLVIAVHSSSSLLVAMQDSRGWPLFCLMGRYAAGIRPQLIGLNPFFLGTQPSA